MKIESNEYEIHQKISIKETYHFIKTNILFIDIIKSFLLKISLIYFNNLKSSYYTITIKKLLSF